MASVAEIDCELRRLTMAANRAEERRDYTGQLELQASIDTMLEQRIQAEREDDES